MEQDGMVQVETELSFNVSQQALMAVSDEGDAGEEGADILKSVRGNVYFSSYRFL